MDAGVGRNFPTCRKERDKDGATEIFQDRPINVPTLAKNATHGESARGGRFG